MGIPVHFAGANKVYGPPEGSENVGSLPTFFNGNCVVSAWRLTPEELEEVNRTGIVFHSVLSGGVLYPVLVGSEESVRMMVADFGPVWKRDTPPADPAQSTTLGRES